jgi:hypothetical protein
MLMSCRDAGARLQCPTTCASASCAANKRGSVVIVNVITCCFLSLAAFSAKSCTHMSHVAHHTSHITRHTANIVHHTPRHHGRLLKPTRAFSSMLPKCDVCGSSDMTQQNTHTSSCCPRRSSASFVSLTASFADAAVLLPPCTACCS